MQFFTSKYLKTDITAVKCIDDYVITAVGGYLVVHQIDGQFVHRFNVCNGETLHGIEVNPFNKTQILVFGGIRFSILSVDFPIRKFESVLAESLTDWILASRWLLNGKFVISVMHNKVLLFTHDFKVEAIVDCSERSIIYSSYILYREDRDLVVFSGTVFHDVIAWRPAHSTDNVIARLAGHKGAIFSLDYDQHNDYLCSTSDDRSAIVWHLDFTDPVNVKVVQKCKVFGHQSRVFRCRITEKFFLTGGEDAVINLWDLEGNLMRRIEVHQGGSLWALDCTDKHIVSGGTDCGSAVFSIYLKVREASVSLPNDNVPKNVAVMFSRNLAIVSDRGTLFYFVRDPRNLTKIAAHEDLNSYHILEVSKCRKMLSLSGFRGEIHIYKEMDNTLKKLLTCKISDSRIFSFHWLTCNTFLTCEAQGLLSLWLMVPTNSDGCDTQKIQLITNFELPESKERWTTSVCVAKNGYYVLGDRRGNIFLYHLKSKEPIQKLYKAHNQLGVTDLSYSHKGNLVHSLGRCGNIKKFSLVVSDSGASLTHVSSDKLPFTWLIRINTRQHLIAAFSGNGFVLWDFKRRRTLLEFHCGGGHRSWDCFFNFVDDDSIVFSQIKNKSARYLECDLKSVSPVDLITSFHSSEVNCVRVFNFGPRYLLLSGGEDTNLILSYVVDVGTIFENNVILRLKSHLSSIRTIAHLDNGTSKLIFSGGGRGQIVCWLLENTFDFNKTECVEQDSYYEKCESEVRVMDLECARSGDKMLLLASCSDGNIKIFEVLLQSDKYKLKPLGSLFDKHRCITKVFAVKVLNRLIVISMSTDGNLSFWDLDCFLSKTGTCLPLMSFPAHQSGINSCSYKITDDSKSALVLTGGDDNAIVLSLFNFKWCDLAKRVTMSIVASFKNFSLHCAQITGAFISDSYFVTASIDQKVAIFWWAVVKNDATGLLEIMCHFFEKYSTSVPDILGMEVVECQKWFDVFIYGHGFEWLRVVKGQPLDDEELLRLHAAEEEEEEEETLPVLVDY